MNKKVEEGKEGSGDLSKEKLSGISKSEARKRRMWGLMARFKATLNKEQRRVFRMLMELMDE